MIQGSVSVVENPDTVPQLWIVLHRFFVRVWYDESRFNSYIPWERGADKEPVDKLCMPSVIHRA